LQTPNPVHVYKAIEDLVTREVKIEPNIVIHNEWRKYFAPMRAACNRISLRETGSLLVPGWDVLKRSRFIGDSDDRNRVYWLYRLAIAEMMTHMGSDLVDRHFCFPGDPEYRGHLLAYALPPRVLFFGGHWTPIPLIAGAITETLRRNGKLEDTYESLAAKSEDINRRVRAMRKHAVIQQLANPS